VKDINTFIFISAFAMGAMIVNSLGIWTLYKNREWAEKIKDYCMCFAAGILISSPLIMTFTSSYTKNLLRRIYCARRIFIYVFQQ